MIAAAALAARAHAQTADPPPRHVVTQPDWLERPTADLLTRNYPQRAADTGVSGHAQVRCQVAVDGKVEACRIVSEDPAGYGFGAAAVRVSQAVRLRPEAVDGKPVAGGVINIPFHFVLPPKPAPWRWNSADTVPFLQVLAAVLGLALAVTGIAGLIAGPSGAGAQPDSTVMETSRHATWPWACLGVGLAAIAAVTPSLLQRGTAWHPALSASGGGFEALLTFAVLSGVGSTVLTLALRFRLAGLRGTGRLPPGFSPWTGRLRWGFIWGGGYLQAADSMVSGLVVAIRALSVIWIIVLALFWLIGSGHLPIFHAR